MGGKSVLSPTSMLHSPLNIHIFVKNVIIGINDQNAHLETEQIYLNPPPSNASKIFTPSK